MLITFFKKRYKRLVYLLYNQGVPPVIPYFTLRICSRKHERTKLFITQIPQLTLTATGRTQLMDGGVTNDTITWQQARRHCPSYH